MKKSLLFFLSVSLILVTALFRPTTSFAGNDWRPVTPEEMQLKADQISKNADAAILFSETYIDDSDQVGVTYSEYVRIKVFTDRGIEEASNRHLLYTSRERIKDVKGRTIKPDGTIVELKKEDVFDKSLLKVSHGQVFEKTFTLPAVTPGSIIEYRYRRISDDNSPRFKVELQQDFFAKEVKIYIKPFQNSESAGMRWITFNLMPDQKIESPKKEGSWIVIKASNLAGLREEPYMPPSRTRKAWGVLWYTRQDSVAPDKFWASLGDTRLGEYFKEFVGHNKEIKKIVPTIVNQNDDAQTKERKLAQYVQHEIHNTTVGGSDEILVKRKDINGADDVLKAKLGDPDYINLLYISMLQAAGIDAHVAFAYSRSEDVFRKDLTDLFQVLEMDILVAVKSPDGKYTFLDPGTAFAPFGYISWDKQWVSALVMDKKQTEFVDVPLLKAEANATIRSAEVGLESNGDLVGKGDVQYTGTEGISLKRDLYEKSPESQPEEWRKHFAETVPNFTSKDEKIENVSDSDKPLIARFDMRIPSYASKTGKRLLLQPAVFTRGQKAFFPASDRVQDIYFHYPWYEKDHVEFTLPQGYTVEELPQPIVLDAKAAVYKQSFKVQGNKLIFDRELNVELTLVPVKLYGALKNFFDEVYKADQYTISLKQASANQEK
ncbi:MAG TPA: DUF3857 domain-containing protein [Blastocatellia bacterium]|nr:DUF3857 domain-containing protein [Blastocatellia bacterium]